MQMPITYAGSGRSSPSRSQRSGRYSERNSIANRCGTVGGLLATNCSLSQDLPPDSHAHLIPRPRDAPLLSYLRELERDVHQTMEPVTPATATGFDFVVSYRFRHILEPAVLALFADRAINLHTSYL